jgi:hypothetical protein
MTGEISQTDLFDRNVRACERSFVDETGHETVVVVRLEEDDVVGELSHEGCQLKKRKSGQSDETGGVMVVVELRSEEAHY